MTQVDTSSVFSHRHYICVCVFLIHAFKCMCQSRSRYALISGVRGLVCPVRRASSWKQPGLTMYYVGVRCIMSVIRYSTRCSRCIMSVIRYATRCSGCIMSVIRYTTRCSRCIMSVIRYATRCSGCIMSVIRYTTRCSRCIMPLRMCLVVRT